MGKPGAITAQSMGGVRKNVGHRPGRVFVCKNREWCGFTLPSYFPIMLMEPAVQATDMSDGGRCAMLDSRAGGRFHLT